MNFNESLPYLPAEIMDLIYEYDGRYTQIKRYFKDVVLEEYSIKLINLQLMSLFEKQIQCVSNQEDKHHRNNNRKELKNCRKQIVEYRKNLDDLKMKMNCPLNSIAHLIKRRETYSKIEYKILKENFKSHFREEYFMIIK